MIKKVIIVVCFLMSELVTRYQAANILMLFTIPSLSNHLMYRPIIDALASRNHSIVIVTTDPTPIDQKKMPNLVEIDVHDISYAVWTKHLDEYTQEVSTSCDKLLFIVKFAQMSVEITDAQLSSFAMKSLMESKQKFDIVIGSIMHLTNLAVAKRFGAPFVGMHPSDVPNTVHNRLGNSFASSYYPDTFYPRARSLATFGGLKDHYNLYRLYKFIANTAKHYDDAAAKHLNVRTSTISLLDDTDLLMMTTDPVWSAIRPVGPNTLYVGDTRLRAGKAIQTELQNYLVNATQGVVYFSLGSNLKSSNLSKNGLKVLLAAMASIPYLVLWKWETSNLPELPPNVITAAWFPQQDILAHPNVKAFITHGGLLSIGEALYHEVPVVVIPFFGDQHFNAMRVKALGIGEVVDYKSMTAKDLEQAIINAGSNSSFRDNIQTVSDRLFDQQSSAVDAAVWWIEYIIRHKSGSHFKHPRISISEYLMIDIICTVTFVFLLTVAIIYMIIVTLIKWCFRSGEVKSTRFSFAPQKQK